MVSWARNLCEILTIAGSFIDIPSLHCVLEDGDPSAGVAGSLHDNYGDHTMKRRSFAIGAAVAVILSALAASCSSVEPDMVKQEDGYHYGRGSGPDPVAALRAAELDVACNALTATSALRTGVARRTVVGELPFEGLSGDVKKIAESSSGGESSVTVRISERDWDKKIAAVERAMRSEIASGLSESRDESLPAAKRVETSLALLDRLERSGLLYILTEEEGEKTLVSTALIDGLSGTLSGIETQFEPSTGPISLGSAVILTLRDSNGQALSGIPLACGWKGIDTPLRGKTDAAGGFSIPVPANDAAASPYLSLAVALDIPSIGRLGEGATLRVHGEEYVIAERAAEAFGPFIAIEAGEFTMGAVAHDRKAGKREAAKKVGTGSYRIARYPVTNAQYAMFLRAAKTTEDSGESRVPEFWDNPEYTQPDQPVVGVTRSDAEAFATWLSSFIGGRARLASEAEWEKAARAGGNSVYPWGDESPSDGPRANYRGNGRYDKTSPVGSFEGGVNAWGVADMAGNVWEMVSSSASEGKILVKGGSWMEGPADLRISNKREVDGARSYADVGFRIVVEEFK